MIAGTMQNRAWPWALAVLAGSALGLGAALAGPNLSGPNLSGPVAMPAAAAAPGPLRAGRLVDFHGGVWLFDTEQGQWSEALRNRALTEGDRISTQRGAQAQVRVGSSELRLGPAAELEIMRMDDARMSFRLHRGSLAVRVRSLEMAAEVDVLTTEGRIQPERAGSYRVDREDDITWVSVWRGAGQVHTADQRFAVAAGQRVELSRLGRDQGTLVTWSSVVQDRFAEGCSRRGRTRCPQRLLALRFPGNDGRGGSGPPWTLVSPSRVRHGVGAPDGGRRLGAVPARPLDLARPLGLDLGGPRALGLCPVPLWAMGVVGQPLGVDAGRLGGTARLRTGPGQLHRTLHRHQSGAGPQPPACALGALAALGQAPSPLAWSSAWFHRPTPPGPPWRRTRTAPPRRVGDPSAPRRWRGSAARAPPCARQRCAATRRCSDLHRRPFSRDRRRARADRPTLATPHARRSEGSTCRDTARAHDAERLAAPRHGISFARSPRPGCGPRRSSGQGRTAGPGHGAALGAPRQTRPGGTRRGCAGTWPLRH